MASAPAGRSSSAIPSAGLARVTSFRGRRLDNRHSLVVVALLVGLLSRSLYLYLVSGRVARELMQRFDTDRTPDRLLPAELSNLLLANGLNLSKQQVVKLFGKFDDEGDGFDEGEVEQVIDAVADLPGASVNVVRAATEYSRLDAILEIAVLAMCGVGLIYLWGHVETLDQRWAGNKLLMSFRLRKMRSDYARLQGRIDEFAREREELQAQIQALSLAGTPESDTELEEERRCELDRLNARLKQAEANKLDSERAFRAKVEEWRRKADERREEAERMQRQADIITASLAHGVDSFIGAGEGKYSGSGAQRGFSHSSVLGVSQTVVRFGAMQDGELRIYEFDPKKDHLGEGRDGAYRCEDLISGSAHALKWYKIRDSGQRNQIFNDLHANAALRRGHPHIVSYDRVVESEDSIFVVMELIKGVDLFEVVVSRGLREQEAKPLFKQLVEALQFLHDQSIIHCDVKPENAMVEGFLEGSVDRGTAKLKLIDFGFSCFRKSEVSYDFVLEWTESWKDDLQRKIEELQKSREGITLEQLEVSDATGARLDLVAQPSPPQALFPLHFTIETSRSASNIFSMPVDCYQAPEHLQLQGGVPPCVATDQWRLGCTLYVMLCRGRPFRLPEDTPLGVKERKDGSFVKTGAYAKLSVQAQDLVASLLVGDPAARPTCSDVLRHPWLANVGNHPG